MKKIGRQLFLTLVVTKLLLVGLAVFVSLKRESNAYVRTYSLHLVDEFRHSSQSLTIAAHAFVATGNRHFLAEYESVLNIHKGFKPRVDGRNISLKRLMAEAGFTYEELSLMDNVDLRSDQVIEIERKAMAAAQEARYTNLIPAEAFRMLHDVPYYRYNDEILSLLFKFENAVNFRTEAALEFDDVVQRVLLTVLACLLLANFFVFHVLNSGRKFEDERTGATEISK